MTRADRPVLHGRDHRPGGVDPIPGLQAASPLLSDEVGADDPTHWWRFREAGYGAGAATPSVAVVGTGASAATAGTSQLGTFSAAVAVGETIAVAASANSSMQPVSCTDSKGNSYALAAATNNPSGPGTGWLVAVCSVAVASGDTFTVVYAGSSTRRTAVAHRLRGLTAAPLDRTASNVAQATTGTANAGTTAVTTQADEIVLAVFSGLASGYASSVPGAGYTAAGNTSSTAGTSDNITKTIWRETSTAAAQNPTMTGLGTVQYAACTVTLKVNTAAGANVTPDTVTGNAAYDLAMNPISEVTANQPGPAGDSISVHRVKDPGNSSNVWSGAATASTDPSLPFTVEGWFKLDNLAAAYDLFSFDSAGNDKLVVNTDGSLTLTRAGTPHSSAAAAVTANNWVYIAYTFNGSALKVYVNPADSAAVPVISA